MHWDWILNPLAQYGMLAAGLIACLALFAAVKLEMCIGAADSEAMARCAGCGSPRDGVGAEADPARVSPTFKNGRARLPPA